ncbi:hypothetical protein LSAT2_002869 [Lamellibrachia satsuma]|nr:hypothetical protein LSAT2_002869 [Lamellibrachia satsuma]
MLVSADPDIAAENSPLIVIVTYQRRYVSQSVSQSVRPPVRHSVNNEFVRSIVRSFGRAGGQLVGGSMSGSANGPVIALWLCTGYARDYSNSLDCIGAGYLRCHDRELCRHLREGEMMTKGEYATVVSVLGCCYAMPLSRHKRLLPDVTNTASFDPLAPCSGHHRSARMALPSESWQVVITEEETTLSELEDIEEALKDGKETLAALLRYLRRHRYNRRRIRRMRRKLLCPRTKQTEDETKKRRRAPCLPRLPKAAHVEEEARDDGRAIELSFRRLAATAQVVDLVRRDEERDARVVRSTVLRRLKIIEVDGHFGLQGLLCKLQRLRAPERRRHGGGPSDVTWRTFARLGRTRPLRFARDYLVLRRLHRLLSYTGRLFAEIIARRQHESLL